MYLVNKLVWFFLNPLTVCLVGAVVGAVLFARSARLRRAGAVVLGLSIGVLWFTSTAACVCLLGLPLERPYLATQTPDSLPQADAIVVLGGGVAKTEALVNPELFEAADRIWHTGRLYKAGKAPRVVVSGANDLASTVPLLVEFGVPREAIIVDNDSRNTYENSRFTERVLAESGAGKTVLLVTSAWHMPRACGNFSKTALAVVPAACDFKAHFVRANIGHCWDWIVPSADSLNAANYLAKEWLGKLARK